MSDLLVRKVPPRMKRELKARARAHGRSLSEETKLVIEKGLRARRFGCIQASGDDDAAVHKINRKHSLRLYLRRARKWAIPIVFFET